MSFGNGSKITELQKQIEHFQTTNGALCSEINRQERVIEEQAERIAELEGLVRAHESGMREAWSEYEKRDELILAMRECMAAHVKEAAWYGDDRYSPQTRGCGMSCTVNGEDCSMSLIERRMAELGLVDE